MGVLSCSSLVCEDEEKNRTTRKIEDIIFTTYKDSVKTRNIERDNRVSVCVDDQTP